MQRTRQSSSWLLDLKRARTGYKQWVLKEQLKSQSNISLNLINTLPDEGKKGISHKKRTKLGKKEWAPVPISCPRKVQVQEGADHWNLQLSLETLRAERNAPSSFAQVSRTQEEMVAWWVQQTAWGHISVPLNRAKEGANFFPSCKCSRKMT